MKTLLCLLMILLPSMALADVDVWDPRYDESKITLYSIEDGNTKETTIQNFEADIKFSADNLQDSQIRVKIPVKNFERTDTDTLKTMWGKDFFDAENHPYVCYETESFKHIGGNDFLASGTLKIKGIELPLDMPFTLNFDGYTAHAYSKFSIQRLPYNIGTDSWADTSFIADEVQILVDLTADRKTP